MWRLRKTLTYLLTMILTTKFDKNLHGREDNIIRLRRSSTAAAYSDQTFPWTMCRSVRLCISASVCPVHCEKTADRIGMPAVCHRRSDGSRDEAGAGVWRTVHGKGYFWGRIWGAPS